MLPLGIPSFAWVSLLLLVDRCMCSKDDLKRDKWRRVHRVCGRAWMMSVYLMPVTAIWVKPWDVDGTLWRFLFSHVYHIDHWLFIDQTTRSGERFSIKTNIEIYSCCIDDLLVDNAGGSWNFFSFSCG